jgi:hypothetical protein
LSVKRSFVYDPLNPRRDSVLDLALEFIRGCGFKVQLTVTKVKRTLKQNSLMWSMLSDIASQQQACVNGIMEWVSDEDWKIILSASLKREMRFAQGIDGGTVMLGMRTSEMDVAEMSDLIELMYAFGARHDVTWTDEKAQAGAYERDAIADSAPTTDTHRSR